MKRMSFGTAGIPLSTKKRSSPEGVVRVRELDLDAMELEFVRGVRMSDALAERVKDEAEKNDVLLTAHGPYWINLASEKENVRERSVERILNTARTAWRCGGRSVTFHCGYYYKDDDERTRALMKAGLKEVLEILDFEGIGLRVCPEVMGKDRSFGKLHEILYLCEEIDDLHPCIDFAHMHAYKGEYTTYDEFFSLLEKVEERLGSEELKNIHAHISGIEYGEKGEKKHLNLLDSDMNYKGVLRALRDFNCGGILISESPNIEGDAQLLKKEYGELSEKEKYES